MTIDEVIRGLDAQVKILGGPDVPCSSQRPMGQSCVERLSLLPDHERLVFRPGNSAAQRLCSACSAYWHVAVAVNQLYDARRVSVPVPAPAP